MRVRGVVLVAVMICMVAAWSGASASRPDPTIVAAPSTVAPGERLTVRTKGFAPGDLVDLFLDDGDLAVVRADDTGRADGRLEVPSGILPGQHWVTAMARGSGLAVQGRLLVVAPAPTWPQVGNDPGRTGAAPDERILSRATVAELQEVWWRDLEVLGPDEEIFVTDSAGEVAEPTAVADGAIVATWFGDVIDARYQEVHRSLVTVLDLDTGAVRWQREARSRRTADRPVVLGDLVVVRWWNDHVLLGLDLADGTERWRLTLPDRSRFGEPLVAGDRILVPVDLPADAVDALWTVDANGGEGASWDLDAGDHWRLVAGGDTVVAFGSRSIIALDRATGAPSWTSESDAWWGSPVLSGDVVVSSDTAGVHALRLRDGSGRWVWRAWPEGCSGCTSPSSDPGGAIDGRVFLRSAMMVCAADGYGEECPHRVRLSAIDLTSGRERWFRQQTETYVAAVVSPLPGPVALTPQILVGAGSLIDLRDGSVLRTIPAPERPGTYGAQHFWFGRPIVSGGRVVLGAADGTITTFAVVADQPRPQPAALAVDHSLPTPAPSSVPTVVPTSVPAPAPEGSSPLAPWAIAAGVIGAAAIITSTIALVRRRRSGTGRHVPHTGSA